jgi:hypothetical protein
MSRPGISARLTTEPTRSNGREPVVHTAGALASQAAEPGSPKEAPGPMRSVHTSNCSAILQELGISVLVTTYEAGKLVMLRPDGKHLNTHFRGFSRPMGLAVDGERLAIGTSVESGEYHNAPAVAPCLETTSTKGPASAAAWIVAVRWRSSACRRCARAPSSAASPSPSGRWPSAAAASGW